MLLPWLFLCGLLRGGSLVRVLFVFVFLFSISTASLPPQTFDDYTLVFGLMAGLIFFGSISLASSGLIMGDSIAIDDALSGTILDPNDCVDKRGEVWIDTWVEKDDLRIESHNVPASSSSVISVFVWNASAANESQTETAPEIELRAGGLGDLELEHDASSCCRIE